MAAPFVDVTGPARQLRLFGIELFGADAANGKKLIITTFYFAMLWVVSKALRGLAHLAKERAPRLSFWAQQAASLATFVLALVGFVSIWFDNPGRLATGAGLVGAGLAFALQQVVSSFAGYFVILRGSTFNVGDRILMGGVRGDVIAINFMQTVVMEMGDPPNAQSPQPDMWIHSRQFSGRIVTISNAKLFESPVFNYTRDFPFLWEELALPISFKDDRSVVERILLEAAHVETVDLEHMAKPMLDRLEKKYFLAKPDLEPRVYVRITDNWVEMTVRFLVSNHDIRALKDRMHRRILIALEEVHIGIASGTYDIVGLPPLRVALEGPPSAPHSANSNGPSSSRL